MNPLFTNLTQETLAYLEDQLSNNDVAGDDELIGRCASASCRCRPGASPSPQLPGRCCRPWYRSVGRPGQCGRASPSSLITPRRPSPGTRYR